MQVSTQSARREAGLFWTAVVGTALLILASCGVLLSGSDFSRGLESDELLTLENYTWAGVHPDGTRRSLDRLDDLQRLRTPSLAEFGIGLWASLARWPEPNNHVVNSFLVNLTLPLSQNKITAARLPALAAGAAFAMLLSFLCWQQGWRTSAPLIGVLAFWQPYVVLYSQTARGYSMMLALTVAFLLGVRWLSTARDKLYASAALVLVSFALVANTVNLILDWVLPCYATLILWPQLFEQPAIQTSRIEWRRILIVQSMCLLLAATIFFVDRLPNVVSSSHQYGYAVATPSEFVRHLMLTLRSIFPPKAGVVLALVGLMGCAVAWKRGMARGLIALNSTAVIATLLHCAITRRFAFERNFGFWLIPCFLGLAYIVDYAITASARANHRLAIGLALYALSTPFVVEAYRDTVADRVYESFRAEIRQLGVSDQPPSTVMFASGVPDPLRLDLPRSWTSDEIRVPIGRQNVILVQKSPFRQSGFESFQNIDATANWPGATQLLAVDPFRVIQLPGQIADEGSSQAAEHLIVLWYLPLEAVTVSPDYVIEFIRTFEIVPAEIQTRYQAKLDVFSRVSCLVATATNRDQVRKLVTAFQSGAQRFGGRLVMLVPNPT